jgi:hypothetical protein
MEFVSPGIALLADVLGLDSEEPAFRRMISPLNLHLPPEQAPHETGYACVLLGGLHAYPAEYILLRSQS